MAIEPGMTGAVVSYFPAHDALTVLDMPVVAGDVDAATFAARIAQMRPDAGIIDFVASRPGQGVSSVFRCGCGFGMFCDEDHRPLHPYAARRARNVGASLQLRPRIVEMTGKMAR